MWKTAGGAQWQDKRQWAQNKTQDTLNMRKHFFTLRVTEHWHKIPRKVVDSSSLKVFKNCLDMILGNWLYVSLPEQGVWTRWPSEVPSILKHPVILWFCLTSKSGNQPYYCSPSIQWCRINLHLWVSVIICGIVYLLIFMLFSGNNGFLFNRIHDLMRSKYSDSYI